MSTTHSQVAQVNASHVSVISHPGAVERLIVPSCQRRQLAPAPSQGADHVNT